jgi:hypothetical protein
LIEQLKLPLISKQRVLESPDKAREFVHIGVGNDNGTILHGELLIILGLQCRGIKRLFSSEYRIYPPFGFASSEFQSLFERELTSTPYSLYFGES